MRTLFTFVALVSAVLVPWSSLAPALLPDASGSAINPGIPRAKGPAARLSPALGILPLSAHDELFAESLDDSSPASARTDFASAPHSPRMVCENGVCRLVSDAESSAAAEYSHDSSELESNRRKLEQTGATHVRVELDPDGQWRCSCSVAVSPGSKVMRRFEATGNTDQQAVQEAHRNVESWLHDHR